MRADLMTNEPGNYLVWVGLAIGAFGAVVLVYHTAQWLRFEWRTYRQRLQIARAREAALRRACDEVWQRARRQQLIRQLDNERYRLEASMRRRS